MPRVLLGPVQCEQEGLRCDKLCDSKVSEGSSTSRGGGRRGLGHEILLRALRHSNKMATRLAVKQLRVLRVSQAPRRGYFLVCTAKRTHCPSYFTGSKRELTSVLSSWRRGNWLANLQRGLATSKDGEDDDAGGDEKKENVEGGEDTGDVDTHEEEEEELDLVPQLFSRRSASPAEVTVPEDFPEVPILTLSRQPLFPKFVRILEVRTLGCK